jgi:Short C-terminal domain
VRTVSSIQLPLEMRAKASRKVGLLLGWLFLMLGSVVTVFAGGAAYTAIGVFGLAFFGYIGLKLFRQRSELAGLVLTQEGVRPVGWSAFIPWSEITQIGVGKYSHNKLVGINVADYDRLLSRLSPEDLRDLEVLRSALKPLSVAIGMAGESPGALPAMASGELKDTLAASRREVGWDIVAMQVYLDRPVEEAAALLETVRKQQTPASSPDKSAPRRYVPENGSTISTTSTDGDIAVSDEVQVTDGLGEDLTRGTPPAVCPNCDARADGPFCSQCGTQVAAPPVRRDTSEGDQYSSDGRCTDCHKTVQPGARALHPRYCVARTKAVMPQDRGVVDAVVVAQVGPSSESQGRAAPDGLMPTEALQGESGSPATGVAVADALPTRTNAMDDLRGLHRKAHSAIETALEPDERVLVVQPGEHAALVATSRRVFLCKWGMTSGSMFGSQVNSWDWAHITGVEHRKGMTTGAIVVQTAGAQLVTDFGRMSKGPNSVWEAPNALFVSGTDADQTVTALRRMVAEHHGLRSTLASVSPAADTEANQIREFAALRDDGIITEDDFQAKKRSILGF